MSSLLQDLRFALRSFVRAPRFSVPAILALALGIGATSATLSVVRGVMLEPLPYRDPDRVVSIWETNPARNIRRNVIGQSNFVAWRERLRSFEHLGMVSPARLSLIVGNMPDEVEGINADEAQAIKKQVNVPVLVTGGFQTASFIRKCISEGYCDGVAIARPPALTISASTSRRMSMRRANKPTAAPRRASSSASPRPIPLEAPVIKTTLLFQFMRVGFVCFSKALWNECRGIRKLNSVSSDGLSHSIDSDDNCDFRC